MKFSVFILAIILKCSILINALDVQKRQNNCVCSVNPNEIEPVLPCMNNPTSVTATGCVESVEVMGNMNNKTCLALQPWSSIQQFMHTCTEIKTEQIYAQWVVKSLCPDLNEDQTESSVKIAEKCINFEDTKCLCENNLYKHDDLFTCFRQNSTMASEEYCKNNGWIIDSSAINMNKQFIPIAIFALFATLFI